MLAGLAQIAELYREELIWFTYFILAVGLIQNVVYLIQLPLAALSLLQAIRQDRAANAWWMSHNTSALPVSIMIPAFNEDSVVCDSVRTTLALEYPLYEVIVINDGSTDKTLDRLSEEFQLEPAPVSHEYLIPCGEIREVFKSTTHPNLIVIDKVNGGKADALNAGLNLARYPTFCTHDADSILEPKALLNAIQPFVDDPADVVATGGAIGIVNGCDISDGVVRKVKLSEKALVRFQVAEYSRAFLMGRLASSRLGILTIISGAFALVQRETAIEAGGFPTGSLGEDYELILNIYRHKLKQGRKPRMVFVPEPVCWTEAPETLSVLKTQRMRWQQGALAGFFNHLGMFMNPRYGRIGMMAMPLALLFDVVGPVVEVLGYFLIPILFAIGFIEFHIVLAYFVVFVVLGMLVSLLALTLTEMSASRLDRFQDVINVAVFALLENLGYRQLNNVWRFVAWHPFWARQKSWGKMSRKGRIGPGTVE